MRILKCAVVLLALPALVAVAAEDDKDKKKDEPKAIVIHIVGAGDDAKYIKEGDKAQKDVTVMVGQTVTWKNDKKGKPHTATSKKQVKDKPLFDTDTLKAGESKSIKFDEKLFKDAGGVAGGEVKLEYFCEHHDEMKSSITLKSAGKKKDK